MEVQAILWKASLKELGILRQIKVLSSKYEVLRIVQDKNRDFLCRLQQQKIIIEVLNMHHLSRKTIKFKLFFVILQIWSNKWAQALKKFNLI